MRSKTCGPRALKGHGFSRMSLRDTSNVLKGHGFSRAAKHRKGTAGFTGCGKPRSGAQEASGHDFSRAVSAAESIRASAPAVCFSDISVEFGPFSAACLAPEGRFSQPIAFPRRLKP